MFWSLEINVPRSTYRPGDTVTGAVHLASQSARDLELDVGSIVIEFTGKTTATKPWPSIPHTIRLFSSKKTLLSGPKKLHLTNRLTRNTNEIEWNFSFTIPSSCDVVERSSISSSSFFNTEPKQPLPPTFKDDSVQGGSCSIVYQLQATLLSLVKDGYYTNQGCSKKSQLQDRSFYLPKLAPLAQGRKSARAPPSYDERRLKLKTSSTEHLPKAVFTVRVQTPSAAVIGQPLLLMVRIDYDANAPTVPPPLFHVKQVSIHLCKETYIAGLKRAGEFESLKWTQVLTLHAKVFGIEAKVPRIEGDLDLREVMDTVIPRHVTPTFKTFNIARTYSLKINVKLQSTGKEHVVNGDYKPCTLFAGEYDPRMIVNNVEPARMTEVDENDPPPSYDVVIREAVPEYSQACRTRDLGLGHARQDEAAVPVRAGQVVTTTAFPAADT